MILTRHAQQRMEEFGFPDTLVDQVIKIGVKVSSYKGRIKHVFTTKTEPVVVVTYGNSVITVRR